MDVAWIISAHARSRRSRKADAMPNSRLQYGVVLARVQFTLAGDVFWFSLRDACRAKLPLPLSLLPVSDPVGFRCCVNLEAALFFVPRLVSF